MTTDEGKVDLKECLSSDGSEASINLSSLSDLVGFPVSFIKEELLIDKENISLDELRSSVLSYLDSTMKE